MFPLPSACFSNGWCALLIRWLKSLSLKYLNFWRFVSVGFYSCPLIRTTGPEVSQWILSVPDIVFLTPLCNSNLVPPGNWDQSPCWVQWTLLSDGPATHGAHNGQGQFQPPVHWNYVCIPFGSILSLNIKISGTCSRSSSRGLLGIFVRTSTPISNRGSDRVFSWPNFSQGFLNSHLKKALSFEQSCSFPYCPFLARLLLTPFNLIPHPQYLITLKSCQVPHPPFSPRWCLRFLGLQQEFSWVSLVRAILFPDASF